MTSFRSSFLKIMAERGFISQITHPQELDQLLCQGQPITNYNGFDATADSLHVGNLVCIMMLYWWQQCGHRPLILMGGGTTKVGDPSGRDSSRQLLDDQQINQNINSIQSIFQNFLSFGDGPTDARMLNNAEWLDKINYIEFLRDYGRHFSINRMLSFDSVKLRLEREQSLSFLEFNYMILQSYDFVELYRRYQCRVQFGGADQWGNIVSGVELGRRIESADLFGFTAPLITTSSGAKMGKTAEGAVWLRADRLSPYDYWQYWRNVDDRDVGRFLRLFTTLPIAEIEKLEQLKDAEINEAKKILATEATTLCHGREAALHAQETAQKTFEQHTLAEDLPTLHLTPQELQEGVIIFDVLRRLGFCQSNGEARRLIEGGGVKIQDQPIKDPYYKINNQIFSDHEAVKVSCGKKRHGLLKVKE